MKKVIGPLGLFIPVIALLAAFHFWGEWARAREWWWVAGDKEGMTFVDILSAKDGRGHVLSTYTVKRSDGVAADEFAIQWDCKTRKVSWGELWTLDDNMMQLDRKPPPKDMSEWHIAESGNEKRVVAIACSTIEQRARMQTVLIERPPIEVTRLAMELVASGIKPPDALILASYSPENDRVGYERILSRTTDGSSRPTVRAIVGAPNK
jgi:hypothetical protein